MNKNFDCLRDPISGESLLLENQFLISNSEKKFPIIDFIPRFVDSDNYSIDFGMQWNAFPKTQLDSFTGLAISRSRLERCLQGNLSSLAGKKVLEAGSGAGRFTEILVKYAGVVHSFDFSNAVEANAINNGDHNNLVLVQADIRKIPFEKAAYDFVICLGVLQHTPSPEESIKCLWDMVKPGGALVIDHYPWNWRIIWPTPIGESISLYRKIVLMLPRRSRFKFVKAIVDFWFPIHWKFRKSVLMHKILRRVSPVLFYYHDFKLRDRQMYYEWALLDTHDATTDYFKHRRTPEQIKLTLESLGLSTDVMVSLGGNGVEAFCRKKTVSK